MRSGANNCSNLPIWRRQCRRWRWSGRRSPARPTGSGEPTSPRSWASNLPFRLEARQDRLRTSAGSPTGQGPSWSRCDRRLCFRRRCKAGRSKQGTKWKADSPFSIRIICFGKPWTTNFSYQDETWAQFSTLKGAACVWQAVTILWNNTT